MCFSAAASFTVAAATGAVGIAGLKLVRQRTEIPLAFVPIIFAGQQAIEGTLWLLLPGDGANTTAIGALSLGFLIVAEVVWPIFIPIVVLLVEPERHRRLALKIILVLGVVLSNDLLQALLNDLPIAVVQGHSIRYPGYIDHLSWQQSLYLLCTCVSFLLSSHRMIQAIGVVIVIGLAVSAYAHYATLVSVWCFFAAADSTLLYFHFKRMGAVAQAQPNAWGK
ncbi:MAG: DUF6629 family protein [Geminicoccaceae bacterium]